MGLQLLRWRGTWASLLSSSPHARSCARCGRRHPVLSPSLLPFLLPPRLCLLLPLGQFLLLFALLLSLPALPWIRTGLCGRCVRLWRGTHAQPRLLMPPPPSSDCCSVTDSCRFWTRSPARSAPLLTSLHAFTVSWLSRPSSLRPRTFRDHVKLVIECVA